MAEYAEVIDGKVSRVLVVNMADEEAQTFLATVSSNKWIKTEEKVSKDFEYHEAEKIFTRQKPFNSWALDTKRKIYVPDLPKPLAITIGYVWVWSEELGKWIKEKVLGE